MSQVKSVILADDRPANLPLPEDIVQLCRDAGYWVRGIPIIDQSRGVISAWVKYGSVKMGDALTQDWVGKVLTDSPDAAVRIPKVAAAVECLIRVIGPTAALGPVGGGPIPHRFFVDWESSVTYDTVQTDLKAGQVFRASLGAS
ncbi:hypothetical protein BGW80DRAFT_1459014 [Lactifluus volemus]|nr:hypothetical protein BGW80DRAFT_1459014 [Lactifluus volemus]